MPRNPDFIPRPDNREPCQGFDQACDSWPVHTPFIDLDCQRLQGYEKGETVVSWWLRLKEADDLGWWKRKGNHWGKETVTRNEVGNESTEFKEQLGKPSTSKKWWETRRRVAKTGAVEADTKLRTWNLTQHVSASPNFLPNGIGKGTPELLGGGWK